MRIRTSVLAWPVLALGGLVVASPAAHASHFGPVSKRVGFGFYREVHRPAYGPVVVGPSFGVPAFGVTQQSAQLVAVAPQAFSFQTVAPQSFSFQSVAPQSFQLQTVAPQSFQLVPQNAVITTGGSGFEQQSAATSNRGSQGGGGIGGGGGGSATACPELVGRLDKIEGRLGKLEDRLTDIEKKVNALYEERHQMMMRAERKTELDQLEQRINNNIRGAFTDYAAMQNAGLRELLPAVTGKPLDPTVSAILDKHFPKK